jgi:hypothetical protein
MTAAHIRFFCSRLAPGGWQIRCGEHDDKAVLSHKAEGTGNGSEGGNHSLVQRQQRNVPRLLVGCQAYAVLGSKLEWRSLRCWR